jgi:hypothetical protein
MPAHVDTTELAGPGPFHPRDLGWPSPAIRLENWQIRLAKATASRQKVPYPTVIRRWIDEGIRNRKATS